MSDKFIVGGGPLITLGASPMVIDDGAVMVEGKEIKKVGKRSEICQGNPGVEFINVEGRLITPGLINSHHHLYSTFACGISCKPSVNFVEILENLWWKLDKALLMEDVYYSALIPLIRCLRSGVTTIIDHHASPKCIRGSLFKIAEASTKVGVRSNLCYEVTDRGGKGEMKEGIEENISFLKKCKENKDSMLAGLFGLHASFTLSDESLKECVKAAHGTGAGFHVHVAEDKADQDDSVKKYSKRVIERFKDHGILGQNTLCIHCIHVSDKEMDILKATDTTVVHNPQSNQNNAVGCADVLKMISKGIRVGLGTDGMTSNMLEELRACNWIHHHVKSDPRVAFVEACDMLLKNNAKIASRYFTKPVGVLQEGAWADIAVFDYIPFTSLSVNNMYGHFMFGIPPAPLYMVFVDGKLRFKEGKVLGINEREVYQKARELSAKVWDRF